MLYLYSGKDTFESYIAAKNKAVQLSKKANSPIKIIEADETNSIATFDLELEGVGLFQEQHILFVKRILQNKKLYKHIEENFERYNAYDIVFWEDTNTPKTLKFIKLLQQRKQLFDYKELRQGEFISWINKLVRSKGIKLSPSQVQLVYEKSGFNKWIVLSEIKKIESFIKINKKETLDNKEIEILFGTAAQGDIWKLLDTISNKDFAGTVKELKKVLHYEKSVHYIIAMLINEITNLYKYLYAKKHSISEQATGIHPFVIRKIKSKAKQFNLESLETSIQDLVNLDYDLKKGNRPELTGLMQFVYKFTSI